MDRASAVYCSTSGTYFTDKDELAEHYKSDFHRYNLKRKIAGLPPVTREWFDSRKEQLSGIPPVNAQKFWLDPLTKKRFSSENTYSAHTKSKKYLDLVHKSGQPAPAPIINIKRMEGSLGTRASAVRTGTNTGTHHVSAPNRGPASGVEEMDEGSEWETASEEDDVEAEPVDGTAPSNQDHGGEDIQEWDTRRSLFDNHMSESMEDNLEYMWKIFGFYFPDAEYLVDPEGLLGYLGAKLAEGHIPLYASGEDPNAKQFASLHAVQRHMVDTNQCKMVFDGAEEEYDDFYDYSKLMAGAEDGEGGREVVMAGLEDAAALSAGGYELALPSQEHGGKQRMLGSRVFMRYYRQRHRRPDLRRSVAVNTVLQQYRRLAVPLLEGPAEVAAKRAEKQAQKLQKKEDRIQLRTVLRDNVNRNLPRNVTF